MKKAIAYVSDIIIGRTGEVIGRDEQRATIERHASENDIEIVSWFEDEVYTDDLFARPGVQQMLSGADDVDMILVERIWALSRNWAEVRRFEQEMDTRGKRVAAATMLWDCVSMMARQFYRPEKHRVPAAAPVTQTAGVRTQRRRVHKPASLFFSGGAKNTRTA